MKTTHIKTLPDRILGVKCPQSFTHISYFEHHSQALRGRAFGQPRAQGRSLYAWSVQQGSLLCRGVKLLGIQSKKIGISTK